MLAFAAQCPARCPIVGCVGRSGCLPQRQAACLLRACSKSPHRVPCFAKAVAARRKAQSTEQKRTRCPASYLQHGRCCLCRASLGARQPMTMLFVAPLAKTGSTGYGVRRNPGHLLRLHAHAKTLSRPLEWCVVRVVRGSGGERRCLFTLRALRIANTWALALARQKWPASPIQAKKRGCLA